MAIIGHGRYLHCYESLEGKTLHACTWVHVLNSQSVRIWSLLVSRVNPSTLIVGYVTRYACMSKQVE